MASILGKNVGLHVIQFPSGRFGFVGAVPGDLGYEVPANKSAVVGGRAFKNAKGDLVEMKFPSFDTRAQAVAHANRKGFEVSGG